MHRVKWRDRIAEWFPLAAGVFLGLALVKFGNPAILDFMVEPPRGFFELVFMAWPLGWAYALFAALLVAGLASARWTWPSPRWLTALPLLWLGWQLLSATQTIEPRLTRISLLYFTALTGGYILGLSAMGRSRNPDRFWIGLLAGFAFMAYTGFEQHYGGLEATRRYIYSQPGWETLPAEHLKRIGSDRIFATLLYPNALAGAILLLLPPLLPAAWRLGARWPRLVRLTVAALIAYLGLACLVWSGSKAGWLIALVLLLVWLLHLRFSPKLKALLVGLLIVGGLTAFFVRYAGYFAKGATSVSARFDYWNAAWTTFTRHPVFGSGPGTFAKCYQAIKPPEAEMTRLTHNDYLQQASDSGLPGALCYGTFVVGSLILLHRSCRGDPLRLGMWIGLLGWALQSVVEFALYIPPVGWVTFWLLGWLWHSHSRQGFGPESPSPGG